MDKKRQFGDRKDGRKLRTLQPLSKVSPYIMKTRAGSQNFIRDFVEISETENFIREMRAKGYKGFGIVHIFMAAYVRTVSQLPGINRFVSGQKIYARNNIEIMMTVKKEMLIDAPETVMKLEFDPRDTVIDVYEKFSGEVDKIRKEGDESNFDKTANFLHYIPGLVLKFSVFTLNFLDYFGWLPSFLLKVSPFHGSFFMTSMGSLGIPPIYHHLYDFGNVPVFCSYGSKRNEYVLNGDGEVEKKRYIDYTFVTDERICDGHYFAAALKMIRELVLSPRTLSYPPENVREDIV